MPPRPAAMLTWHSRAPLVILLEAVAHFGFGRSDPCVTRAQPPRGVPTWELLRSSAGRIVPTWERSSVFGSPDCLTDELPSVYGRGAFPRGNAVQSRAGRLGPGSPRS